jgi:hypothetical protein
MRRWNGVLVKSSPSVPSDMDILREFVARHTLKLPPAEWVREVLHWEDRIGLMDQWQIDALNSTGNSLWNCTRQAGKSTTAAAKGLRQAVCIPKSPILLISPSLRQSSELFRKVQDHIDAMDHPPKLTEDNKLSCTLANGSRIISLPGEEKTIRGFSKVALLIEDEAARVSDELNAAIRPMLAVSGGQLLMMSTPFGKRGHFFEAWENGGNEWGRTRIPWMEIPRITKEFVDSERKALGDWWIRQEYECEFVQTTDQVFSYDLVLASMSDDIEPLFLGGEV